MLHNDYDNTLVGGSGVNGLYGYAGNDTIYGNAGADYVHGGEGNDILYGGAGADYLYGETGADVFVFENATAFSGLDTVYDFNKTEGDAINIADLLWDYDPMQDAINDFVSLTSSGGNTTLRVDRDGNGGTYSAQNVVTINSQTWSDVDDMLTNAHLIIE